MQKDKKLLMKYYLRGVGTGLAAAVLLLGLSGVNQKVEALDKQNENPKVTESSSQGTESSEIKSSAPYEPSESKEPDETIETSESGSTTETSESSATTETSESTETSSESTDPTESSETATSESNESGSASTETSEGTDASTFTSEGTDASTSTSEGTDASTDETSTSESTEAGQQGSQAANDGDYTLTIYRGYSSWTVAKILAQESIVEDAKAFDDYLCKNGYDKRIRVGSFVIPEGSDEATIAKIITGDM
jgi:hypothetical protein